LITPTIESTGSALYQSALMSDSRTVLVELEVPPVDEFKFAAFADSEVTMLSNTCVDSFDSRDGAYDGPNLPDDPPGPYDNYDTDGTVGTNSISDDTIYMDSNASIYGNVKVGVSGDPNDVILDNTGEDGGISGIGEVLTEVVEIPSVTVPSISNYQGNYFRDDGEVVNVINTDTHFTNFVLTSDAIVTIDGDVNIYIEGNFALDSDTQFIISNDSSARIYVDGTIKANSNSVINNYTQDPTKLNFIGTDAMVDAGGEPGIFFGSNAQFYGTVKTKNASVFIDSNTQIFGAVMADKILMNSDACIHYDVALKNVSFDGSNAVVALWQEK